MTDPSTTLRTGSAQAASLADLAARAAEARKWSYSPYSGYAVGAAVLAASGKIYDGANVENAATISSGYTDAAPM